MIFLGTYKHSLDAKNRLSLPAKLVDKLSKEVYISKGFDGCLEIRSEKEFKEYSHKLLSHSNTKQNVRQVQRVFLSLTTKADIDSAKRILLPSNLLAKVHISKDVLIIGVGNKIEIWDLATYEAYEKEAEATYEAAAEQISNDNE